MLRLFHMKLRLLPLIYLLSSSVGLAAYNETLTIKKVADDGNQFIFARKEGPAPWNGITIKDPQTKAMLYEARVTKCNATSCIGVVVRNHSGIKLRADEEYVHSYNEKPIQYDPEQAPKIEETKKPELKPEPPKPEVVAPVVPPPEPPKPQVIAPPAVVEEAAPEPKKPKPKTVGKPKPEPKDEPKKVSLMDREFYGAYGSPIGPGFKVGYFKKMNPMWVGINYAKISSETNSVSVDGHLLSIAGVMNVMQPTPSLTLNLLAELGVAKATLDFSGVDEDGPTEDETTYFLALGGEARLTLDKLSFALRSGVSKAGFGTTYEGSLNAYNNPYGTVLVFLEIGAYYRF